MIVKILLNTDEGKTFLSLKKVMDEDLDEARSPGELVREALDEVSRSVVEMWEAERQEGKKVRRAHGS